jgi:hypothetical protein
MWLNDFLFSVLTNFTAFAGVNVFTAFFQVPFNIFTNVVSAFLSGLISP